jgi:hypothetical protein
MLRLDRAGDDSGIEQGKELVDLPRSRRAGVLLR